MLDNAIAKRALRLFNERYRKLTGKALRHWLVTELGHKGTENIHLHGLIWTDIPIEKIQSLWQYGYTWPRNNHDAKKTYVNNKTINYITKYVHKQDEKHKHYNSKVLSSPGIGSNYINEHTLAKNGYKGTETDETYRTSSGHKIALPIYWRNKIYTDEQKEKLWLHKLDKQERYVCGEKIDISISDENYKLTLEYYRIKNKKLGYGNNRTNEAERQYEHENRVLNQMTRLKKGQYKSASGGVLTQDIG